MGEINVEKHGMQEDTAVTVEAETAAPAAEESMEPVETAALAASEERIKEFAEKTADGSETEETEEIRGELPDEVQPAEAVQQEEAEVQPAEVMQQEEAEAQPAEKKSRKRSSRKKEAENEKEEEPALPKPDCPEAAIEAVLFATGNSVQIDRLADILNMTPEEVKASVERLKVQYEEAGRGITITELEDAVQLGTKGEYYEYLVKLAKHPRHYSLSDTVIETLSIIAYKQPVTRAEIERIRGVSSDHALNKLIEYELVEEVGRLDAPGKPLLFGTTEQFLRSFGVKSIGDLPTMSPEMLETFKEQAEAEAAEDMEEEKIKVDV